MDHGRNAWLQFQSALLRLSAFSSSLPPSYLCFFLFLPGRSQDLYTVASSTGASSSGSKAEAAVAGADAHQVRREVNVFRPAGRQAATTRGQSFFCSFPASPLILKPQLAFLASFLQVPVAISSFAGKHMHLFLRKHADRLGEDVLEADAAGEAAGKGNNKYACAHGI